MLSVTVQNIDGRAIFVCEGRLVRGEEKPLLCMTSQFGKTIILEMSKVTTIDAAGVGLLISLQVAGIHVVLLNPTAAVRKILRITEADSILEICSSPEALSAVPLAS